MNSTIIGFIIAIGLFVFFSLQKKDSKLSSLGINFKRVFCPKCNNKQPIRRKTTTQRQFLNGGYTCGNCQTEMDKWGSEIKN
jgi:predicted SprT family Zn-dependent metalloprotease